MLLQALTEAYKFELSVIRNDGNSLSFLDIMNDSLQELTPCPYAPKRKAAGSTPVRDTREIRGKSFIQ